MNQRTIPSFTETEQHAPYLALGYFQSHGCRYLRQLLLLYLVQDSQSVPFSLIQSDPLQFHGPLGLLWNRTFLLCTNRTFSFCGDRNCPTVDLPWARNLICRDFG